MKIDISLDSTSPGDLDIIGKLVAALSDGTPAAPKLTVVPEPEPAKPTPVRKPAPAKPAPEPVVAEESAPTPEQDGDEDLMGGDFTREQVVARATQLLSEQKASVIKGALATVGAKRVSELKPSQFTAFMAELG